MTQITTLFRTQPDGVECELDVTVQFAYHRARRGARDSLCGRRGAGPPLEPDEPEEIEIEEVTDAGGTEFALTPDEEKQIEEEIWKDLADHDN